MGDVVISRVRGAGDRFSTYEIDDDQLAVGSTLGAPKGVTVLKANGAIETFYASDVGERLIGPMQVRFWDGESGTAVGALPGKVVIHPDRQEHLYELDNGVLVTERVFMRSGVPSRTSADPAMTYYRVELENTTAHPLALAVLGAANLRGSTGADVRVRYDEGRSAFLAVNRSNPATARAFASMRAPSSWELTHDHGKASRARFAGPLAETIARRGSEFVALFEHRIRLRPGARTEITFVLAAAESMASLRRVLDAAPSFEEAEARTRARYEEILSRAMVMTPDAAVNRGVLWAKANMLRTMLLAPTGWCFVNDPARSNNSVGRDTAWFAFGADYVLPDFARESLLWYAEHLERSGEVVEYYDIRTGKAEDYGLNINDNTPLLILALWHHYNATGDEAFLARVYRGAVRAARAILAARNRAGLVWCSADGTADWGIAGWRNVIEGYRLSGATTELNSECYAALRAVAEMATRLGKRRDAQRYAEAASTLREAINRELTDPETGLYYLNIGVDGFKHTNVTCDLVFPVMFGVADEERAARIVSRLSVENFWTQAGMRTVPRGDLEYGPTHGFGLLGGVWVGVTFWFAFAAARFNPDFMASALHDSFVHYSRDPRRNNTVPGQFSEWLHGETLVNQGMMLSPWFPPRYLWAAIEGAAGLDLSGGEPTCTPRLAPQWRWLGVRRLRFRGAYVSWFAVRAPEVTTYATFRFAQEHGYEAYDRDVTDELLETLNDEVVAIAFERADGYAIFAGNTSGRTVAAPLRFKRRLPGRYRVRTYATGRGEWVEQGETDGRAFARGMALQLDRRGFTLVELHAL